MTGTCKEWNSDKGYGTITDADGANYFCHFSAIQSSRISLNPGEVVTFEPAQGKRGQSATMVKT